jgi:hypothetical protein
MHNPIRSLTSLVLLLCYSLLGTIASAQLTSPVGVEFLGRDQFVTGNPACVGVNPSDVAGVLPQSGWTPVDNHYNVNLNCDPLTFIADNGTTLPLADTNFNATGITLTFTSTDSWDNNTPTAAVTTPNSLLMQGTIKQANNNPLPLTFTFNNVPPGQYDVYIYCQIDGSGVVAFDVATAHTADADQREVEGERQRNRHARAERQHEIERIQEESRRLREQPS